MNKTLLIFAGVLGFLGVALGAFGAHSLQNHLSAKMIETYRTGILYHLIHSVVLMSLAVAGGTRFNSAGYFFIAGIILFSFTLYIYSLTDIKIFAMITPVGGISFLIGWALVIYTAVKA